MILVQCLRQDGGYPTQLLSVFPQLQPRGQTFDNVACSGNTLSDISGQLDKLNDRKFDLITLTISGNDFGFDDVAVCPQNSPHRIINSSLTPPGSMCLRNQASRHQRSRVLRRHVRSFPLSC